MSATIYINQVAEGATLQKDSTGVRTLSKLHPVIISTDNNANAIVIQQRSINYYVTLYLDYIIIIVNGNNFSGTPAQLKALLNSTVFNTFATTEGGTTGNPTPPSTVIENAATYAAISNSIEKRLIKVTADETNNGNKSLYLHDGTTLYFLQTIQ